MDWSASNVKQFLVRGSGWGGRLDSTAQFQRSSIRQEFPESLLPNGFFLPPANLSRSPHIRYWPAPPIVDVPLSSTRVSVMPRSGIMMYGVSAGGWIPAVHECPTASRWPRVDNVGFVLIAVRRGKKLPEFHMQFSSGHQELNVFSPLGNISYV